MSKRYTVVRKTYGRYHEGYGGGYIGVSEITDEIFADEMTSTEGIVLFYSIDNKANNRHIVVAMYNTREIIKIIPEEL